MFSTNDISLKGLSQIWEQPYALNSSTPSSQTNSLTVSNISNSVMEHNFYEKLKNIPDTLISLQYNPDEFLSFKVCGAEQGKIVWFGNKAIGLQCKIGSKTYTFNRKHLNQMSNRERRDLFNYLEVDDKPLS